ncbi:hypothetical protein IHC87_18185 [Photobacterium damselae subsp. damselae]|uniref:hypothetical protein n=1 Tax=Photobacterium damselae TaxID=38293 RepID=UPI001F20A647|nr:hypothetical protein [Photobacterium damselae]UJZ96494.1 hypothetical protein IHC87_18185 [Photobacterium damselae subsp. damselae]UJZ99602.1 hypothetical protein IHC88_19305 [Photobacterium damselae subsp. damselae]
MGIASETYANITRQMYEDWEQRFYPKQKELLDRAASGELATEQINRVDRNMQDSMRSTTLSNINYMARYGVDVNFSPNTEARQALGLAGAKNAIRESEQERSMGILSGSGMGLREKVKVGGM